MMSVNIRGEKIYFNVKDLCVLGVEIAVPCNKGWLYIKAFKFPDDSTYDYGYCYVRGIDANGTWQEINVYSSIA